MEEQHVYPISKQVIGGDVQSLKLSPKQFNAYRDEQDAQRVAALAEMGDDVGDGVAEQHADHRCDDGDIE